MHHPIDLLSRARVALNDARLVVGAALASYGAASIVLRSVGVSEPVVEGIGVGLGAAVVAIDRFAAVVSGTIPAPTPPTAPPAAH